jgi:hypothetical protein
MQAGRAVPERIGQLIAQLDQWRASVVGDAGRLAIVGGIAEQLLLKDDVSNATALEAQWSALTRDLPFLTVCCYSMESFVNDAQTQVIPHLCAEHMAVAHAQESSSRSLSL